jgi:hypothetical protein
MKLGGGVTSRREALAMAGAFLLTMACNSGKLLGTQCGETDALPAPAPNSERKDVHIVDSFSGLQLGTRDNPYSARSTLEFDGLMRLLQSDDSLALHLTGRFGTKGVYRWGQYASRNLGRDWTVDGEAELSLDPSAIADVDGQPLYCLAGPARSVTGIGTIGNHSRLADRWKSRGQSLRTGAVLIEGDGSIDDVTLSDFGSLGAETFVAIVAKGSGQASITRTHFKDFDPSTSDSQVTVRAVTGMESEPGLPRPFVLMEENLTEASGSNLVQAHTIYQALRGLVRYNTGRGIDIGYYGDYYATKGIKIVDNDFECRHGVALYLSPTAGADTELPKSFSHEDYTIGWNRIVSSGANVSLNTNGPSTATRFIRHIAVDARLSLESFGDIDITRPVCKAA